MCRIMSELPLIITESVLAPRMLRCHRDSCIDGVGLFCNVMADMPPRSTGRFDDFSCESRRRSRACQQAASAEPRSRSG
jgi:hypothetical protein